MSLVFADSGKTGLLKSPAPRSPNVISEVSPRFLVETYILIDTKRIPNAITIHIVAQNIAGMPVAFAMFMASVGTEGAKGDDKKKTVLRSSSALRIHCTARKLTKNVATRELARRATATSPTESRVPATRVKGIPDQPIPDITGLNSP